MAFFTVVSAILCIAALPLLAIHNDTLASRVPASPVRLSYHKGPLLSGPEPIKLLITFYGDFESSERYIIKSFLSSFSASSGSGRRSLRASWEPFIAGVGSPSVSKWWSLTQRYSDSQGRSVSQRVEMVSERNDSYSLGRHLRASDMANLARDSVEFSSAQENNVLVLVLTSADVYVEGFCMHACGSHAIAPVYSSLENPSRGGGHVETDRMVPYAWVGNSKLQCPGYCAWPFAKPQYGPPMEPLKAPNSVGIDGMIISLAKLMVGVATNPLGNAFYLGNRVTFGCEAGSICSGVFGSGAYPGYPGELVQDVDTGASYNMEGLNGLKFLVPWIWDPATQACAGQA